MDKRCKVVGIACMWPFFIVYLALASWYNMESRHLEAAVHVRNVAADGRRYVDFGLGSGRARCMFAPFRAFFKQGPFEIGTAS